MSDDIFLDTMDDIHTHLKAWFTQAFPAMQFATSNCDDCTFHIAARAEDGSERMLVAGFYWVNPLAPSRVFLRLTRGYAARDDIPLVQAGTHAPVNANNEISYASHDPHNPWRGLLHATEWSPVENTTRDRFRCEVREWAHVVACLKTWLCLNDRGHV